jgi:hypothetical protein
MAASNGTFCTWLALVILSFPLTVFAAGTPRQRGREITKFHHLRGALDHARALR